MQGIMYYTYIEMIVIWAILMMLSRKYWISSSETNGENAAFFGALLYRSKDHAHTSTITKIYTANDSQDFPQAVSFFNLKMVACIFKISSKVIPNTDSVCFHLISI